MRLVIAAMAACLATIAWGQTLSQLNGTVTDTSEAVVSGANVVVRNTATGVAYTATTNQSGIYSFPFLQPGTYDITCELAGFKKFERTGIVLETGGARTLDLRMEVGALNEIVRVA